LFSRKKQKRKLKKTLKNKNLQQALSNASSRHYQKYKETTENIPWQEYKEKARAIKEECIKRLPQLIQEFSKEAKKSGAHIYQVSTPDEALKQIEKIARKRKARLIVKSKSMVSEEIGLNDFLEKKGYKVVETDLGEWIVQLAKERPSHITAPALHKTKEEVAKILGQHLGIEVSSDLKEIVRLVREKMRQYFIEADIGISGANMAVAETGTLVIISNEGNARLVTSLPPVHIALLTTEKFVQSLEQAASLIKTLTTASSGHKLTSYVSLISGPSCTTDIEKELVIGAHGPEELHIIILDNKRLKIAQDENLKEILYCLKCGGCMLICPVFQAVGGHVFGGPVYPGGIGILLTIMTHSAKEISSLLDYCADCKKCDTFCPVGIPTSELLLELKNRVGPNMVERALSAVIRKNSLYEFAAKIFSIIQSPWNKNGYLENFPFAWAKGKSLPALRLQNIKPRIKKKEAKVYFFQGCLAKLFFPEIRESVISTLSYHGFEVVSPPDQVCCGAPSLHLGHKKDVRKLALNNLKSFEKEKPDYILTVCPTGNSILKKTYPKLHSESSPWVDKIYDFTEFLVTMGLLPEKKRSLQQEIYYHYPCHYLEDPPKKDKPKELIQSLGFNLKAEEEPLACCGFCGVFSFKNPEISARIWERKRQKILENKVNLIATDCPGCLFQLRANLRKEGRPFEILHTAELYSKSLEK
jgi:L-lactate dehydrogenase complex protein LldF